MSQDTPALQGLDGIPIDAAAGGVAIAGFFAFLCVIIVVGFLIQIVVCFLMYKPISKLPEKFRPFSPGLVFLMLVPIANFVMPFLISLSVTDGFKNYFTSIGDHSNGDCGKGVGLAWAIAVVCSVIPFVNYIAAPVALVCMIIFIVKLWSMGNAIKNV
ncbi:MAG: hypothetical protein OSA89_11235 [Mariniblastus sp.]|nr:hypothetical protein [Mariniblastus sp.]